MKRLLQFISTFHFPAWTQPIAILGVCLASYSLLINRLGFYWDDYPLAWISHFMGPAGLERYFSTNRPFLGWIVQLTTSLLGTIPWHWHLFAVIWRWLSGLALWALLRRSFPDAAWLALATSLLFVVYPGSPQQFIALFFSHMWIVLTAFLLSLLCTLLALRNPRRFIPFTILALLLSLVNLVTMEYFFMLELLRPLLVWIILRGQSQQGVDNQPAAGHTPSTRQRLVHTLSFSLPYLLLFIAAAVWRAFFFPHQTTNYQPGLLDALRAAPFQTLAALIGTILADLWTTTFSAWGQVFQIPDAVLLGQRTTLFCAAVTIAMLAILAVYLLKLASSSPLASDVPLQPDQARGRFTLSIRSQQSRSALQLIGLGIMGLLLGGLPYWLVQLPVNLGFPISRLTISFMLGVCLFWAGVLALLPFPRWTKLVILAVTVSLGIGWQFQNANIYRRDQTIQSALFWQMSWRIPQMQPGVTLLADDLPVHFSTDNSLTAPLNWIYAPGNHSTRMDYLLYYPSLRLGSGLSALRRDLPIQVNYLAAEFEGSTSQVIAVTFSPPACLRVLDPEIDPYNLMLPGVMREAARLSDTRFILFGSQSPTPDLPKELFGLEPARGWCYYFERADLARQVGDWAGVARLGDQAFALNDYPNDPSERLVFIEGYAHTGKWSRALELTGEAHAITPLMQPLLCRLWQRIESDTAADAERDLTLQEAQRILDCQD